MVSDRSFVVDPLSYFSFHPVLHDWCGMVHIKEPLLLIEKSNPCSGGIGFPLLLSETSFAIYPDAI